MPKLSEKIDSLTKKMTTGVRLTNEADPSAARDEYEKLNIMATSLFNDFISTSKRPLVDRVKLEEALSQQVDSCASKSHSDDQFQPEPASYFDTDHMAFKDEYLSSQVVKLDEQPPYHLNPTDSSGQEHSKEFLSETGQEELLQSSSASCESLTSTKIVFKKMALDLPPADHANPLSPINHSDQDDAVPEAECNNESNQSDTHSSLQIIDFSNDSNMDLI